MLLLFFRYIPGLRSEAIEGFVKRAAEIAENIGFEVRKELNEPWL